MDGRATKQAKWLFFVLAFIILRTLFALVLKVNYVSAKSICQLYANDVIEQWGSRNVFSAQCSPDSNYATVGHELNSLLVLDMGEGNEIVDGPGTDFYYYERPFGSGIQLDQVEVAVAGDDGLGNPAEFSIVFVWGDDELENNGSIPLQYIPEVANRLIIGSDLHNQSGIGIDIGNDDEAVYRFIRFQTHPTNNIPMDNELVEVDAVEGIHPSHPETLTPTIIPVETLLLTPTPNEISITNTSIGTNTGTVTEIPAETLVDLIATPTPEASTLVTMGVTNTAPSFTSTMTYLVITTLSSTDTSVLTFVPTITLTVTYSLSETSIIISTPSLTHVWTAEPVKLPSKTPAPYAPADTLTFLITRTLRSNKTFTQTSTVTFTKEAPSLTLTRRPTFTPSPLTSTPPSTSESVNTPIVIRTPAARQTPAISCELCKEIMSYFLIPESKILVLVGLLTSILAGVVYTLFLEEIIKKTRSVLWKLTAKLAKLLGGLLLWAVVILWKALIFLVNFLWVTIKVLLRALLYLIRQINYILTTVGNRLKAYVQRSAKLFAGFINGRRSLLLVLILVTILIVIIVVLFGIILL